MSFLLEFLYLRPILELLLKQSLTLTCFFSSFHHVEEKLSYLLCSFFRTLTRGLPENHDKSNTETSESDDNNIHPDLESSSDDNNDDDSDFSETHMVTIGNLPKNITTFELQEFLEGN